MNRNTIVKNKFQHHRLFRDGALAYETQHYTAQDGSVIYGIVDCNGDIEPSAHRDALADDMTRLAPLDQWQVTPTQQPTVTRDLPSIPIPTVSFFDSASRNQLTLDVIRDALESLLLDDLPLQERLLAEALRQSAQQAINGLNLALMEIPADE